MYKKETYYKESAPVVMEAGGRGLQWASWKPGGAVRAVLVRARRLESHEAQIRLFGSKGQKNDVLA